MQHPFPGGRFRSRLPTFLFASALLFAVATQAASLLGCATGQGGARNGRNPGAAAAEATRTASGWFRIPLRGLSSAMMPKQPTRESETLRLADGARLTTTSYGIVLGQVGFIAVVNDYQGGIAGDPLDVAANVLESFLGEIEGFEVVTVDATIVQGHPGTSLELRHLTEARRMRLLAVAGRSAVYIFGTFNGAPDDAGLRQTEDRFFASITLDRSDAPSPDGDGRLDFAAFTVVNPPETSIAVELPGAARRNRRDERMDDEPIGIFEYSVATVDAQTSMVARVYLYDDRPDGILERLRESARQGEGTVGPVRPAQRQGYGGQAYMIESEARTRFVVDLLVPGGAVQLIHSMPRGQESAQAEHRRRFLNSLRIL